MKGGLYKPAKSILALVVVLGLLFGVFFRWMYDYRPWTTALETEPGGESNPTDTNLQPSPTPVINLSGLSTNQLLQRILDSVAGNLTTQEAYASIPASQLGGLTFEEYQRYISLIDLALTNIPKSFSPMTVSERDRQIARIVQVDPAYREIAEASTYHWLEYTSGSVNESLAIAIQRDSSGLDYLDRTWIRNIIDLYDYAQTYFGTIKQENAEVLSAMIYSDSASSKVKLAKAKAVLDYYDVYKVAPQGLKVKAFDISRIRYDVTTNYTNSDTSNRSMDDVSLLNRAAIAEAAKEGLIEPSMTRQLQLFRNAAGVFSIQDTIPSVTTKDDFVLRARADGMLLLNSKLNSAEVEQLFGSVLDSRTVELTVSPVVASDSERNDPILTGNLQDTGEEEERTYMFVLYDGIELLIENPEILEDGKSYSGTLVGYSIFDVRFKMLNELGTESTVDDALMIYPFIDQTDYVLKNERLGTYLSFPLAGQRDSTNETIGAIRVGRIEELGLELYKKGEVFGSGDNLPVLINPKAGFSWKGIHKEGDTSTKLPVVDRPMAE